ncbi:MULTISPECIES: PRC-barrel domain-containing protein [Acidiphilium]|uniref:PRC-barrel domain-containing protein n=1 Tax=Acidiphilium rubrum TaxID=526 RepID=A0A8G2FDW6_ACIRU|nr:MULTISPECIES: PRC-barrel domain-containing protein [Acidiphilium]SIQ68912.1 PRC-barrel domain-containing protein [Acidiphilium rubrum]
MSSHDETMRTANSARAEQLDSLSETRTLIAASKVNGTHVYNRQGDSIGSIYDVMIDKNSGRISYAIMSFGGFLGLGEHYHPLPWSMLHYDRQQGGYVVDIDRDRLEGGPSFATSAMPDWSNGIYGERVDEYYGVHPGMMTR